MAALRIAGLAKSYGSVIALDGLDLEVAEGEFFVILGPSAAGKTTTLRAIAGLERADAGRIFFAGRDVTDAPVQGRDMAMIFQTFALYPHLSTFDNLAYPLRESRVAGAEIRKRVDAIAAMLGIGHTLARRPATLSGGEQQRLAIGRALIQEPDLLLLDEPLTNLDAKLRHDTRAEFKRLHRELGMTMVYATPDQLEALTMGERIAVLREGRIVQTGTPDELYLRPADQFVATMVGAPPMNLVPGKVKGGAARAGDRAAVRRSRRLALARPAGRRRRAVRHPAARPDAGGGSRRRGGRRPGPAPGFRARVHLTEPLGDMTVIDVEAEGTVLKVALPEERALAYRVGDELALRLSLADAHLFYQDSGAALDAFDK